MIKNVATLTVAAGALGAAGYGGWAAMDALPKDTDGTAKGSSPIVGLGLGGGVVLAMASPFMATGPKAALAGMGLGLAGATFGIGAAAHSMTHYKPDAKTAVEDHPGRLPPLPWEG